MAVGARERTSLPVIMAVYKGSILKDNVSATAPGDPLLDRQGLPGVLSPRASLAGRLLNCYPTLAAVDVGPDCVD